MYNAREVVEMTDHPIEAIKTKKDSSMNVALDLVKQGKASACVSSGNTGALLSASQLKLKESKEYYDLPSLLYFLPNMDRL